VTGALYFAAKAPRPGLAKTRLGAAVGHAAAIRLYRAFLCDLAGRFASAPFPVGWYVTPPDAWPELAPLVGAAHPAPSVLIQPDGDWGARQSCLLRGAAARGEDRIVLAASDSPQLGIGTVADALARLETHDLVLGPVPDGGYYLIGMRGYHDILRGVRMSTGSVLDEILGRAGHLGLSVALTEPTFDVDESADLVALRSAAESRDDMPATRAALREVRAPVSTTSRSGRVHTAGSGGVE
jgi:glycosyltransferase A (GT-A) superfamily protein (DUF2064 family)